MKSDLSHIIKQNLRLLRLKDMAEALEPALQKAQMEKPGYLQFLAQLLDIQIHARQTRSLKRRIHNADFPKNMSFDNFDWNFQPGLPVELLKDLKTLSFIHNPHPVLILGKTGVGKTHIATALGVEACKAGLKVKFFKLQKLLSTLYATLADDTTDDLIHRLARMDLLIIDHIGHIRTKTEYPSLLFDLICACQERTPVIVTSGISLQEWSSALGNPTITNDIVDRLFHRASVINIRPGRSYRSQGPHAPHINHND